MAAAAKETVNSAYELSLAEGLRFERRIFHSLFALVSTQTDRQTDLAFIHVQRHGFFLQFYMHEDVWITYMHTCIHTTE